MLDCAPHYYTRVCWGCRPLLLAGGHLCQTVSLGFQLNSTAVRFSPTLFMASPCTACSRGVFWDRKNSRWRAQVGFNNRKIFMGYFGEPAEAARAYDKKVVQLHGALGEFGSLIIIPHP
eukprot:GHUV01029168.1.p1 GENE.GHUV01029168.1~~GHUV01029168.1.p1  ORF type:complete len:119 (+),score=21.18 GHUV01029168.1:143-499(+)